MCCGVAQSGSDAAESDAVEAAASAFLALALAWALALVLTLTCAVGLPLADPAAAVAISSAAAGGSVAESPLAAKARALPLMASLGLRFALALGAAGLRTEVEVAVVTVAVLGGVTLVGGVVALLGTERAGPLPAATYGQPMELGQWRAHTNRRSTREWRASEVIGYLACWIESRPWFARSREPLIRQAASSRQFEAITPLCTCHSYIVDRNSRPWQGRIGPWA